MTRLFPNRHPSPTIPPMAHNSLIISTAAEVVLDKRFKGDEAKCAEAARRMERLGGDPGHQAVTARWCESFYWIAEEMDRAGLDGRGMVQTVLLQHRHLVAM